LQRGYATASTDTGHIGDDLKFGDGHPEKVVDWAHRAIHLTADVGKLIVRNHTGRFPDHSYFVGCSTGGHQALSEAQRYPDDYDGIVAGIPRTIAFIRAYRFWTVSHRDGVSLIPNEKLPMITSGGEHVRRVDGVKDGIIDDPRRCRFDPASLLCRGEDNATCLTAAQVGAVKAMYLD
jgi:feruloyl esterase